MAPRGMLQKSALEIKPRKKNIYLWGLQKFLLNRKRLKWQLTTEQELNEFKWVYPNAGKTSLVGNVPKLVSETHVNRKRTENGTTRLLTVALISPMKNHHLVLNALGKIKNNVEYDMYGPVKDPDYWELCQEKIKGLPRHIRVRYKGEAEPTVIEQLWKQYDYYIQPSQSENFGHAIFEALSAGLPVIISDQTPWRDLANKKAGWDVPLKDPEALKEAIQWAIDMKQEEYNQWRKGARQLAMDFLGPFRF